MPTPRKSKRFGGSAAHQRLMMANLAASLFAAEAIVTTEAKAKALRPDAEKLITKAKKAQDEGPMRVHRIRQIQGFLGDREMTHKLVNEVAPRYLERNGGYTRILKLGARQGDARRHGPHRAGLNLRAVPTHCDRRSALRIGGASADRRPRPVRRVRSAVAVGRSRATVATLRRARVR